VTNYLVDPGFEQGVDMGPWVGVDGAYSDAPAAKTGLVGAILPCTPGDRYIDPETHEVVIIPPVSGAVEQLVATTPGNLYQLVVFGKIGGGAGRVQLAVEDPAGSDTWAWNTPADAGADWAPYTMEFTATSDLVRIRVQATATTVPDSALFVDDTSLTGGTMPTGLRGIYRGVVAALRGINGDAGGYHYDLSNRVLLGLVPPSAGFMDLAKGPYVCLPLDSQAVYNNEDGAKITVHLRQRVVAYLPVTNELRDTELSGPWAAAWLHDDILRRTLPPAAPLTWDLASDDLHGLTVVAHDIQAGLLDGVPWDQVVIELDAWAECGRDNL